MKYYCGFGLLVLAVSSVQNPACTRTLFKITRSAATIDSLCGFGGPFNQVVSDCKKRATDVVIIQCSQTPC